MPALSEPLQPFFIAGIDRDDNLFRLREEALRQTDGTDTYRTLGGGLRFAVPVSRQLFSGVAEASSVKFDQNSQLDYSRKNFQGDWHWALAAHFEGHIGGRYLQDLASFADFDSVQRNLRTSKRHYADGSWRFHPSWRVRTGYTNDKSAYDLPSMRTSDRTEEAVMSGIDYLARSGSTVGLQLRRLEGSYPRQVASGDGNVFSNGYVQDEAKLNVLWLATGSTQVLFLGGWVQRKPESSADRTQSGTNARLIVNWTRGGRMKLAGQAWREFSAIDGARFDSALNSGASADVTWDFSAKIHAVASLKRETRDFTPFGGASVPVTSASSDKSNTRSVALVYKPLRTLTLKASAFHDERAGSLAAGTKSYKANGAAFNAILEFQ